MWCKRYHNFVPYTIKMDTNGENLGEKMMNNGAAMEWGIKNEVIKVNVLWVLILHYTTDFVAFMKEALSNIKRKKRGIREEAKSEKKEGQDATEGIPSRLVQNKLLIAFLSPGIP
jgi:hypothetical protein